MNPAQTTQSQQNSGKTASPFDQIRELEQSENARVEVELAAMRKEKEEVTQAIAKKEEQATEEIKAKAKKELKEYSEKDLSGMLKNAEKEAIEEEEKLEARYAERKDIAIQEVIQKAKNPETFSLSA